MVEYDLIFDEKSISTFISCSLGGFWLPIQAKMREWCPWASVFGQNRPGVQIILAFSDFERVVQFNTNIVSALMIRSSDVFTYL